MVSTPPTLLMLFDDGDAGPSTGLVHREKSDAVNEEAHATSVPPHAPPQTLWLLDNFNIEDSYDRDAGPSTGPVHRERSDAVNEEAHATSIPPHAPPQTLWLLDNFNIEDSYDRDAGPSTSPIDREASHEVNEDAHATSAPPHVMVSPLQNRRPFDQFNNQPYDASAGPSTGPGKRGRGRPKGSKNGSRKPKKPKAYDNNSTDASAGPSSGLGKRRCGRPKGLKNRSRKPKKPKADDPNSKMVISCPDFDSRITEAERESGNQEIVDSILMRFDAVRRRLCQLNYRKDKILTASTNCMNLGVRTNMTRRIGPIPGVQVGDIFYYWCEMCLVGLHRNTAGGIDSLLAKESGVDGPAATSVVTSGKYDNETEDLETLIYSGHGGKPCDQVLQRGNRALEASVRRRNEVRVIRGELYNNEKVYIYDGLYLVSDCWQVTGKSGFKEYRFKLLRKPGQPPGYAIWKLVENLRNHELIDPRQGFILGDLSFGEEGLRVPLVNEVDEEDKTIPDDFDYIRSQCYSGMTNDVNVDSQSLVQSYIHQNCTCILKNCGQLPYHDNILVCRKPLIYECGGSCPTRMVETGLKLHLEVFKTSNCGWGLRSWDPIRAGTFICEFTGVSKTKEEVEEDDDYLFDTSRIYHSFRWNYEPELLCEDACEQVSEDANLPTQVLISAKEKGNVGRFMNHNCWPNVFWQPIEYDDNNGHIYVRIGLFAMKHIPPMTELTYDYGISCVEKTGEDEVIYKGKKICLCGSVKCRGSFG
ncbi:SET domain group 21 [Arabidopsis thaliana]|uniref:Histone-lysine N-methyltransferase, H3 lysine-9 specific SUVH8 n=1 Tax=Arabidopsis thaliana TaxID=3702 RepID=SUVH8_ARATH|nr:SET domain group 21 [Arabidopsis thaliana]Q9C5P0.1 RecName: Full=Histone-lysine N-methyltransferase, H3 lysine-9 specific SUVH8; AltName: Full=Histone H3-K9 methyltransferase 8; Short=H3-K9-HMTase 8; AltName: Full=Protein SET DOMAIN GROUP 21; AltName: Full=Suppressor of variegation 3-9 homolog protein 8; Short=Su(var)3-9 homolog protein 8 [Arabidopsis thaliana]AAK28973.1 SUVH8 [Arabidopsis thaliana]AEC07623.1 SET domain group 21 [Arabidopsis thaliana]|eukprot:NP_180049.2 SET domain group 21 [Arabidopsis thaliana]